MERASVDGVTGGGEIVAGGARHSGGLSPVMSSEAAGTGTGRGSTGANDSPGKSPPAGKDRESFKGGGSGLSKSVVILGGGRGACGSSEDGFASFLLGS